MVFELNVNGPFAYMFHVRIVGQDETAVASREKDYSLEAERTDYRAKGSWMMTSNYRLRIVSWRKQPVDLEHLSGLA